MEITPLYISYGMPKSGSTLAFELPRTMLELAGVPQVKIANTKYKINFVNKLDGDALKGLQDAAKGLKHPLVIKTHSVLCPAVNKLLKSGMVTGHAICRDPRDMALSMLDAARENRAWGGSAKGKFQTVADTEQLIHKNIALFTKWAEHPNMMTIHYVRLAFNTERVAVGIEVDIKKAIEITTGARFTQFNQGKSQRWKTEMDPADARRLEKEFKDYITIYCSDVPSAPKARKPASGFLTKWIPQWGQKSK